MIETPDEFDGLDEFPFRPPEQYRIDTDVDIEFLTTDKVYEEVFPRPERAAAYIGEETENFQYDTPIASHVKNTAGVDSVQEAYETGYILPAPGTVVFKDNDAQIPDSLHLTPNTKLDDYVDRLTPPQKDAVNGAGFSLHTRWAVNAPEEYAILCLPAPFIGTDAIDVYPQVIDPSVGTTRIAAQIVVTEPGTTIRYGDPLMQLIPVRFPAVELDAVVEIP